MKTTFENMAERWPSALVSRQQVGAFTGGVLSERYLANLDSKGLGPAGRIRIGRKVAYPVPEFVKWLESRSAVIPERQNGGRE